MRQILIPTDFSDNALNAIDFATNFFKDKEVTFYILHAYEEEVYQHFESHPEETLQRAISSIGSQSQLLLEALVKNAKEKKPISKHKFKIVSAYNSLVDECEILISKKNIDLILMGTKGKTPNNSNWFGSNTLQVLKYVSCPVLAIPSNYSYSEPHHALFPSNFLIPYKKRELGLVKDLFDPFDTKIELLNVSLGQQLSKRQEKHKEELSKVLENKLIRYSHSTSKNVLKTITQHISDNNIDFLIMVNTRHSFLEDILFESKVDKISLEIKIPFLALQNIKRHDP